MAGVTFLEKLWSFLYQRIIGKRPQFPIGSKSHDLVFAGGGAKGLVHVGALMELEARGVRYHRLVGTSAGAILAAMLAAGYTAEEMLALITKKDDAGNLPFASFMDVPEDDDLTLEFSGHSGDSGHRGDSGDSSIGNALRLNERLASALQKLPAYRQVVSFVEHGGVYAGDRFLEWLIEMLNADGRNLGHTTMAEFYRRTGREFTAVATDTTDKVALALNHRTAPDLPVAWSVRMSMGIPFIWKEVHWRPSWGRYRGKDIHGHTIVDGGVISNFPLYLVLSKDRNVVEAMGETPDRRRVIGLLIDDQLSLIGGGGKDLTSVVETQKEAEDSPPPWKKVETRITNLLSTMTRASDNAVAFAHPENVCRLPAKGIGTLEFDMDEDRIHALVNGGQLAMKEFLE